MKIRWPGLSNYQLKNLVDNLLVVQIRTDRILHHHRHQKVEMAEIAELELGVTVEMAVLVCNEFVFNNI